MLFLTSDQHVQVLRRLTDVARGCAEHIPHHPAGIEYTSLMTCFLLHNLSAAETISRTLCSFGKEWFPVSVGYMIARTMFEVEVTAHYIAVSPSDRARQYISFAAILNKQQMDACKRHCGSQDSQWREAMNLQWQHYWAQREGEVLKKFDAVASLFTRKNKKGKAVPFTNWAGKSIREMASEVDHLEAYDIFYSELSSFTHADVHLADRYLRADANGPVWSQRANDGDVGNVFRHAASFLTCFLELFGREFGVCADADVHGCWQVETDQVIN